MAPKTRQRSRTPKVVVATAASQRTRRHRDTNLDRRLSDPERLIREANRARAARGGRSRRAATRAPAVTDGMAVEIPAAGEQPADDPPPGAAGQDGEPSNTGKRGADDDDDDDDNDDNDNDEAGDDDGRPSKRQKTDQSEDQAEDQSGEQSTEQQEGPCERYQRRMEDQIPQFLEFKGYVDYEDPVPAPARGEWRLLFKHDVWRAVYAVAEAISATPGHRFSLMDENTLDHTTSEMYLRISRPQCEALIPFTKDEHTSLFILRRLCDTGVEAPQFQIFHQDSARRNGHARERETIVGDIRRRLPLHGWQGTGPNAMISGEIVPDVVAYQYNEWACGYHTIFNAWAYALGLQLSNTPLSEDTYTGFLDNGSRLIQYAVCGLLSSQDIKDFFDCYNFIGQNQNIAADRVFNQTFSFLGGQSLTRHAGLVRIREQLDEIADLPAGFPPGIEGVNTVVIMVEGVRGGQLDIFTTTGQDLLNQYNFSIGTQITNNGAAQGVTIGTTDQHDGGDVRQSIESAPTSAEPEGTSTTTVPSITITRPSNEPEDPSSSIPQAEQRTQAISQTTTEPQSSPAVPEHTEESSRREGQGRSDSLERAMEHIQQAQAIQGLSSPLATGEAPAVHPAAAAQDETVPADDADDSNGDLFDPDGTFDMGAEDGASDTPTAQPTTSSAVPRISALERIEARLAGAGAQRRTSIFDPRFEQQNGVAIEREEVEIEEENEADAWDRQVREAYWERNTRRRA